MLRHGLCVLDAESLFLLGNEPVKVVPGFLQVGEGGALPPPAKKILEAGSGQEALVAREACAGGLDGVDSLDFAVVVVVSVVNNPNTISLKNAMASPIAIMTITPTKSAVTPPA